MSYKRFPIFLDLRKKIVLVVGGGAIALQKVKQLVKAEANILLISKNVLPEFYAIQQEFSSLSIKEREIKNTDVENIDLLIVATQNSELNKSLVQLARKKNIWANSVDDVHNCDFYTSSTVDHGDVRIAIASDGKFPGLTRALRRLIQEILPESDLPIISEIAGAREKIKSKIPNLKQRTEVLRSILKNIEKNYLKTESVTRREA